MPLTKSLQQAAAAIVTDPDPETEENDELGDESEGEAEITEEADRITPYLQEADYSALVTVEFPNTEEDTVSAYAKIAGRRWTYYVRALSVNIGRQPDKDTSNIGTDGFVAVNGSQPDNPDQAHIDLGPSKLVSRLHARVAYKNDDWHIEVCGRNGVRVNGILLKRTQSRALISGDVIEIAGTEMIFVTPSVPIKIHEMYLSRLETHKPPPPATRRPRQLKTEPRTATLPPVKSEYARPPHISPYPPPGAPASSDHPQEFHRPTTPVQGQGGGLLQMPYLAQNANAGHPYDQHMTIENHDQIDYASDAFKDVKPPMSYATLIAQAILSRTENKLSLSGIYEWIQGNFAYYRHNDGGWQVC